MSLDLQISDHRVSSGHLPEDELTFFLEREASRIERAQAVNRKHFDRDSPRHPKFRRYRTEKSQNADYTGNNADYGLNGTNNFLKALGFTEEDVTRMELAYGNRLVQIGKESIDFVKLAIGEFFTDENLSRYDPRQRNPLKSDFISYLEVLSSTWKSDGTSLANIFLQSGNLLKLNLIARSNYRTLSDLLNNPDIEKIDQNARTSLQAATALMAKYVIGKKDIDLTVVLSYGNGPRPTLGDVMPQKLVTNYTH